MNEVHFAGIIAFKLGAISVLRKGKVRCQHPARRRFDRIGAGHSI